MPGRNSGALGRDDVEAYAYFRVGYHRGLDRLRQSGWRGIAATCAGSNETNRGFLRALDGLRSSAEAIGETDEAARCAEFLHQLDPERPPDSVLGMKRALITGITGQDGRHLSQFLTAKGYQVFGLVRGQDNPKIGSRPDREPRTRGRRR